MLGLRGGNEVGVDTYVLSLSAHLSTPPPPFNAQRRVNCSDLPLHPQTDPAEKEYEKSKNGRRMTSSRLNLPCVVTGKEASSYFNSFHTEQLANTSLSPVRLLVARGVTRLLRREVSEEMSDLEEKGAEDEIVQRGRRRRMVGVRSLGVRSNLRSS